MGNPIKTSEFFDPLAPGTQDLLEYAKAVQGLGRNYRTFAKNLEGDGERVKAILAGIATQGTQLAQQAAGINTLNEQERRGMAALQVEYAKLRTEQQRLQAVQAAQARAQQVTNDATKQATSAFRALQNELREAYAAKDTARIEKAAASIRQAKTDTLGLSAALRGANSEYIAAAGSYDALDAQTKKLILSLKALQAGLGGGGAEAAKLEKQIADNTEQLKVFDARIGVFNRNVGNYRDGFAGLVQELAKARAAQAGMAAGTEEYNRQQLKVAGFQTAAQRSAAQMGLSYEQAEAKINGVTGALQPLATSLLRLEREQEAVALASGRESEAFRVLGFQIESTKKQLNDVAVANTQVATSGGGLAQQLGFTKDGLQQYAVGLAASTVGLTAAAQAGKAFFDINIEYSRQLAEVRKTTGLTADEAERLAQSLEALDTPTTLAGLLKIASVGGTLGVAKGDLLEFTKAIDTAVQALGNDFGGGAEEIATVLGKLGSVYRKELGPDQAKNILAIGSAINQLSADGAATAPFLTDVALRIGAIAASSELGLKNGLAYAAVLQEQGYAAEVSGTALNRLFSTLSTKTKEAYEIAKLANPALTLQDFTRLVNTDFNQAIQVFLRGLKEGGKTTTEQSRLLATLKLQSGEAKSAIVTLSQNTELFAERQKTANDQLRDATSLAVEASVNIETLGGSVDQLENESGELVQSGFFATILKGIVDIARTDLKLLAAPFREIGNGIAYVKEKLGITKAPLTDYTSSIVETTLATRKQSAAQQQLVLSYIELQNTTARSTAQELEMAQTRAKLLEQFGTADVAAVQASIDKRREAAETNVQFFKNDIAQYDQLLDKTRQRAADAQNALNASPRAADGRPTSLAGQKAAEALTVAERDLAEQQRLRGLAVAALAKLEAGNTQAKKDGTEAAEAEAAAELELDRTAQERAKNRVQSLQAELAANQRRIDQARKLQAEQGQLFIDHQLDAQTFAESVAGSEQLITQYERDGAAIRIRLAKAESAEKLAAADNDRVRQSRKKDISQRELNDIEGQYAQRRIGIAASESAAIGKIYDELAAKLEVKPLEFKVAKLDANTLRPATDNTAENDEKAFQRSLTAIQGAVTRQETEATLARANGEISEQTYQERLLAIKRKGSDDTLALLRKLHKSTGDEENANAQLRLRGTEEQLAKRLAIIDRAGQYAQELEGAFYSIKGNLIDGQIQRTQAAYDAEVKAAGDNAELKAQIDQNYQKRLAKLNFDKAKAERDGALYSILISTAVGIAKAFAEYVFPFALIPAGIAAAQGALQAGVVLSKPLPAYFVGREDGPAEWAQLAEKGPEIVGKPGTYRVEHKPTVGYLAQGDRVYTAAKTRQLLAQNDIVEGRIVQRTQQADLEIQTSRLRSHSISERLAERAASQRSNAELVLELRQVRRAVESQEQLRVAEGELQRWKKTGDTWEHHRNKRYHGGRPR